MYVRTWVVGVAILSKWVCVLSVQIQVCDESERSYVLRKHNSLFCILAFAGTFGQSERWNLSQPSTYQHPKLPNETIFDTQGLPSIDTSSVGTQEETAGSDSTAVNTTADKPPNVYRSESVVSAMCCKMCQATRCTVTERS